MIRRTLSLLLFLGLPTAALADFIIPPSLVEIAKTVEVGAIGVAVDGVQQTRKILAPDVDGDGTPDDPGKVIGTSFILFFGNQLGGQAGTAHAIDVAYDPYLASANRITNTGAAPIFLSLDLTSLMEPFRPGEGTGSLERFLRFTLTDANQNGAASFGPANIFFSVQERSSGTGTQAGGFLTATLAAPGVLTRLDGTEAPLNVFLPGTVQQFDGLRFQLSGTLSAGDELLIEVFSCFRKGAQTCPPRPPLEAPPVPVPGAAVLLATALGGLAPWLRRRRSRA